MLLGTALCAVLLAGCATGGPEGAGDADGRQNAGTVPATVGEATILDIAERTRAAGDLASAVTFYRRAHAMNPMSVKPLIGLGGVLNQIGAANEAAEAFREALQLAPNDPDALRGLGVALVALNQAEGAVELFHKALAAAPDVHAFAALGVAHDLLGDYQAAEDAYRQGLALAPQDLALRNNLGLSQMLSGNYAAAIETLRSVAGDPAAGPRHRLNLALALGLAGREDEAAQVARIDLDERSVRSNLAYYLELRALPERARAQAILRPGGASLPRPPAATCDAPPCGTGLPSRQGAAEPDKRETVGAYPVAPVERAPIAVSAGLGGGQEPGAASAVTAPKIEAPRPKPAAATAPSPEPRPRDGASAKEISAPTAAVGREAAPDKATPIDPDSAAARAASAGVARPAPADGDHASQPAAADEAAQDKAAIQPGGAAAHGAPERTPAAPEDAKPNAPRGASVGSGPAAGMMRQSSVEPAGGSAGDWLQVGALRDERAAEQEWVRIMRRNEDLLKGFGHRIMRANLGPEKGVYYRLRVGPVTSPLDARNLCTNLKDRRVVCFLVVA